jgi:phage baseplate assembly protein W
VTADPGTLLGRGIAFPPRLGPDGRLVWSAGDDNIRDAIRVILQTDPGERLRSPGFGAGLDQFLFEPNTVATHRLLQDRIVSALAAWEPRISVESVDVVSDPDDPEAAIVTIAYRLVATQARAQLAVSVGVGG